MTQATTAMRAGPAAVVIGLGSVVGLQTARLLAARGVRVIGIAGDRRHFAARTRVCDRIVEADVHGDGFLDVLERSASDHDSPPVLFPCTDNAVLALSRHRDRLADCYRMVLPAHDVVRALADKAAFAEHAGRHGLPIPQTFVLRDPADAERAALGLRYPAVLKPAVKSPRWTQHTNAKALRVDSPEALLAAYRRVRSITEVLVAQALVGGGDDRLFTCNAYFGEGSAPLVTFVTRKRRQWPPHLGTASYAQEWRDDEVLQLTLRLFASLPFRGLGYLEVKRDPQSGGCLMIESNIGRPTGRSATAEAGGVELLATMYCDAAGLPLPSERAQGYGNAGWIDIRRDVLSAAHHWRRGELDPLEWPRSLRGPNAHAVLSLRDPLPFAAEIAQSGRKAAVRLAGRLTAVSRARAGSARRSRDHGRS